MELFNKMGTFQINLNLIILTLHVKLFQTLNLNLLVTLTQKTVIAIKSKLNWWKFDLHATQKYINNRNTLKVITGSIVAVKIGKQAISTSHAALTFPHFIRNIR